MKFNVKSDNNNRVIEASNLNTIITLVKKEIESQFDFIASAVSYDTEEESFAEISYYDIINNKFYNVSIIKN